MALNQSEDSETNTSYISLGWLNPFNKKSVSVPEVTTNRQLQTERKSELKELEDAKQQLEEEKKKHAATILKLKDTKQQLDEENLEKRKHEATIKETKQQLCQHQKEIQALQTYKSRVLSVLILILICLPIFIGSWYQYHTQQTHQQADNSITMQHLRKQLDDQSYKMSQLRELNTDLLQTEKQNKQSIQMYKTQVTGLDTTITALKDEITQCEKDIQYKNANYAQLAQECETFQNEARRVQPLEHNIEEISRKMQDCEVDYGYCKLEKAQMTEINKQLSNRCK
eukprot:270531_1